MSDTKKQELIAFLNRVIGNAKKLEPQLHEAAMRIAQHAQETGDATPALHLYENLPKSQRRKAIAAWWAQYTQIVLRDSAKNGVTVKLDRTKEWAIDEGNANPFFNMDENSVGRPMGEIDAVSIRSKKLDSLQKKFAEWEAAPEEKKVLIFKPGVNPQHEMEQLQADIAALTRSRKAA